MFFIVLDFKIIEFFRPNSNTTKNAELSSRSANTKQQKKTTKKQQQQQHLRHCENEARKKMKLVSLPLDIPYTILIDGVPRLLISLS